MVPGKGSRSIFSACEIERRPRCAIASCARSLYVVTGLAGEVILVRLKKHFRGGRSLLKAGFAPDLVRREAPASLPTTKSIEKPTSRTSHYKVAAA